MAAQCLIRIKKLLKRNFGSNGDRHLNFNYGVGDQRDAKEKMWKKEGYRQGLKVSNT